jgi:hypothetical protein
MDACPICVTVTCCCVAKGHDLCVLERHCHAHKRKKRRTEGTELAKEQHYHPMVGGIHGTVAAQPGGVLRKVTGEDGFERSVIVGALHTLVVCKTVVKPSIFAREFRLWTMLPEHPNIAKPLAFCHARLLIWAPHANHVDLKSWLMTQRPDVQGSVHPHRATLAVFKGMTAGLHWLHTHGVFHGDFHTGNVLVRETRTSSGTPQITALVTDLSTSCELEGARPRTRPRMRPHLAPEKEKGPAADTWALGILMAYCWDSRFVVKYQRQWPDLTAVAADSATADSVEKGTQALVEAVQEERKIEDTAVGAVVLDTILLCLSKEPLQRPTCPWLLDNIFTGGEITSAHQKITADATTKAADGWRPHPQAAAASGHHRGYQMSATRQRGLQQ